MSSCDSSRPALNAGMELFKVKHYINVYNLAFDLTGSIDAAKELTARVFELAARRFEYHPIPLNCDMYLSAQVYLLYAQKGLPASSSVSAVSTASSPETAGTAPNVQAPKPDQSESAFKYSPSAANSLPTDNASKTSAPVSPMESETTSENTSVVVSKQVVGETPATRSNVSAVSEAVYDKKHTEFWTPDFETWSTQLNAEEEDEAQETEEAMNKPSILLSLLNAFLVIACLASIAFLLLELKILPRLL